LPRHATRSLKRGGHGCRPSAHAYFFEPCVGRTGGRIVLGTGFLYDSVRSGSVGLGNRSPKLTDKRSA
jgi:hypothetical protein